MDGYSFFITCPLGRARQVDDNQCRVVSYLVLGRKEEARKWLRQAAENQRLTLDDKEVCFPAKSSVQFNPIHPIRNSLTLYSP